MWQPAIEGRSRRVIRIHHKLVKSRQQLTQALKKRMREGEDFYFEMRNDFYIIQVYGPKDLHTVGCEIDFHFQRTCVIERQRMTRIGWCFCEAFGVGSSP
ncbi:hypothetical protein PG987_013671 [Apiospora arundinis]